MIQIIKMFNVSFYKIALTFAILISSCGSIPHSRVSARLSEDGEVADSTVNVHQPHLAALSSHIGSVYESVSGNSKGTIHSDQASEADEDSALPVLIHKNGELSGISSSTVSSADKSNTFIRSKRSTCAIPANLPELVRDLNSRLSPNQLVGLIPESRGSNPISGQPNQCHDDVTNKWWPRSEVNLRSTCPWNITEVDLGVNAFPRYINKAVCLCVPCIGAPAMRCEETRQTVTYLYRLGCQNGLAVMDTRNVTVTVGCHCVTASPQSATPRPGPITP